MISEIKSLISSNIEGEIIDVELNPTCIYLMNNRNEIFCMSIMKCESI